MTIDEILDAIAKLEVGQIYTLEFPPGTNSAEMREVAQRLTLRAQSRKLVVVSVSCDNEVEFHLKRRLT